jgi:hypothetical protein
MVLIYEYNEDLELEDLTWTEIGKPLLPEEKRELSIRLKMNFNDSRSKHNDQNINKKTEFHE